MFIIDFLYGPIISNTEHQLHQTQLPDNEALAKTMMSALTNGVTTALIPWCRRGGSRKRDWGRSMCNMQLLATTATNSSALHSLTWYSCKNSLPLRLSQGGETMPSLVLQSHPVKSAASSTANFQSCFSHVHLATSTCKTVNSTRPFPVSTDQVVFPV